MKIFAVFDELVDVVEHVFVERRGEKAAVAERAMAEFAAALAPGNDLAAVKMMGRFFEKLVFAGRILVNNFAVVEDRFDFLRSGLRAERKRSERRAARTSGNFFACQECCAKRCASVSGDRLNKDVAEAAALLQRANQ